MNIKDNLKKIKTELPLNVKLVAVSKTKPAEMIMEAYNAGHKIFGENKAQELSQKHEVLPKDIEWHFIGHLQTNKVKYIAPFVSLIHSVDSLKLMKEINKHAVKNNRVIDCLLQFHIAEESTKFGLNLVESEQLISALKEYANIRFTGVMGMATNTDDKEQVRREFKQLHKNYKYLKEKHFKDVFYFKEISMGMSGDYKIALEEGSTMVRLGTAVFGARNYQNK